MRQSHLFGRTLREAPSEAETPGHQLLLRAGLARPLKTGIYSLLPLGFRAAQKLERIIREEMDRIGGQEMEMPVFVPAEYWKETGQWDAMEPILFRFRDHRDADYVISYTHEQIVTHHARNEILSYRQLPVRVYHFQMKGRDETRARAGLLRVREFVMKDSYSLDADAAGLDESYRLHHEAYRRIFERAGVRAVSVESDTGAIGGELAHEFQVLAEAGEDTILICPTGDYKANRELAVRRIPHLLADRELATRRIATASTAAGVPSVEPVDTPGTTTIDELQQRLGVPESDLLKTILLRDAAGVVAVVLPGDREVNEPKLRRRLGLGPATKMPFANEADFESTGGVAGYVGPIGLRARIIVDSSVEPRGYVAGANKPNTHLRNVLPGRDFDGERADVHDVRGGDLCPKCGTPLEAKRGIEVGNIFKLGTYYSAKMNATYLAEDGSRKPFVMGSYGIGIGRTLQALIEVSHDDRGIIWPMSVAPYEAHVIALPGNDAAVRAEAESLVDALEGRGVEVLFDDREESAGVKFADADLIGIPFRITVSARGMKAGTIEVKPRTRVEIDNVPRADAAARIADLVASERARYAARS
ncbi:MAG: proline--tRNA ligase [Chloroflexi bacterium RIFCSPLOWO2_12_FULL_71_12]|nr:MAG: proline--tRNA ligase [Chloroflexi bacterium RIFCSPLOWO2_12_FULL_71_12]